MAPAKVSEPTRLSVDSPSAAASAPRRYEDDLYGWAVEQEAFLRQRRVGELDWTNIAEEFRDVSGREYDKLERALMLVLMHMLKWDYQPARRSRSWENTIRTQRRHVQRQLLRNPGLKARLTEALLEAYDDARDEASTETGLPVDMLPAECRYDWAEITSRVFQLDQDAS